MPWLDLETELAEEFSEYGIDYIDAAVGGLAVEVDRKVYAFDCGICARCFAPIPSGAKCARCKEARRRMWLLEAEAQRGRRAQRAIEGLCSNHAKPVIPGLRSCDSCLKTHRRNNEKRSSKNRTAIPGVPTCLRHGAPTLPGKRSCAECQRYEKARGRTRAKARVA